MSFSELPIRYGHREPISRDLGLADDRIVIDIKRRRLWADGRTVDIRNKPATSLAIHLASKADHIVSPAGIISDVYGYANLNPENMQRLAKDIRGHMHVLRSALGDELGDSYDGAFRTVHGVGYVAVSSLSIETDDLSTANEEPLT